MEWLKKMGYVQWRRDVHWWRKVLVRTRKRVGVYSDKEKYLKEMYSGEDNYLNGVYSRGEKYLQGLESESV